MGYRGVDASVGAIQGIETSDSLNQFHLFCEA